MPTLSGCACLIDIQNASSVWPDSVRPLLSVTVTEMRIGQPDAASRECLLARDNRRLRIQRVEDRLDQDEVGPAVDESERLVDVRIPHRIERRRAIGGIVHVGRERETAIGRSHRPSDEARLLRRPSGPFVGGLPCQARAFDVHLVRQRLEAVVGLRDGGRAERVGLDDVRPGRQVLIVDFFDDRRLRQDEHVAVALELASVRREPLAAEPLFR